MKENPVYTSRSTVRSLWQEYRIYDNRVEFATKFGLMVVPFEHIEQVDAVESDVQGLLRGNLKLKNFRPALKLDWANFLEHIVLDKSEGYIRRILFTPDDPLRFGMELRQALSRFRS